MNKELSLVLLLKMFVWLTIAIAFLLVTPVFIWCITRLPKVLSVIGCLSYVGCALTLTAMIGNDPIVKKTDR